MRLKTLGIGQCIAQNQASFSIGVQNFNGLTTHAGDHITRLHSQTVWHVFTSGNQANDIDLGFDGT